jgi:hypothetical protein
MAVKFSALRAGNYICFHPQVRGETPTLLGPLERANPNHWTTYVSIKVKKKGKVVPVLN